MHVVRRRRPRLRSPAAIARLGRRGFRGSRRRASDPDLRSSSGGSSGSSHTSDSSRDGGHKSEGGVEGTEERSGSWEMKEPGLQRPMSFRRRSFDEESAFGPRGLGNEIKPIERI